MQEEKKQILYCGMNPKRTGTTLFDKLSQDDRFEVVNTGCKKQCRSFCSTGFHVLIRHYGDLKAQIQENDEEVFLKQLENKLDLDLSMYYPKKSLKE